MALHHVRSGEVSHLVGIADPGAKTVALAKTGSFETIHLVVRAGSTIPSHKVDGSMSLYCIEGHVRFEGDELRELRGGDWLHLAPGTAHELSALVDSSLLLTIMFDMSD